MSAIAGMAAGALSGSLGSAIGGSYGSSQGSGISIGGSTGYSGGSSAGYAYSNGQSMQEAYGLSNSYSEESYGGNSRTYGREASAQDRIFADAANQEQWEMWKAQADYNASEAQKARDFQEQMSNTAYQRAVKDLLSAGLNPILAVGNMGASTPQGATATSGLSSAHKANAHAESESKNWGSGKSSSHSENRSSGWSKDSSRSQNSAYNYGYEEGYNRAVNQSSSIYNNNLNGAIGAIGDLFGFLKNNIRDSLQGALGKNK